MVAKLAVIVLAVGAAFAALLVNRQQRIDVVADLSRSQLRMEQHRKTILRLRAAVAESVKPSELHMALAKLPVEWQPIPYRFNPLEGPARGAQASTLVRHGAESGGEPPSRPGRTNAEQGG